MRIIQAIGARVIARIEEMGAMLLFLLRACGWLFRPPLRVFQITKQLHFVGFQS